jgi:hypothetical protein
MLGPALLYRYGGVWAARDRLCLPALRRQVALNGAGVEMGAKAAVNQWARLEAAGCR